MHRTAIALAISLAFVGTATAETVCPKYADKCVVVDAFACVATPQSSFVRGGCYDAAKQYLVLHLNAVWYHYCGVPKAVWDGFLAADSKGRFYDFTITNAFDCRLTPPPTY